MGSIKDKYLGGSRRAQKQVEGQANKFERKRGGGGKDSWLIVENGRNVFRIAPPHSIDDSAYEVYRTTTIKCMKPIYKDGEDTGEKELGNKRLVCANPHNSRLGEELGDAGDPIALYCKMVKDIAFGTIKDKDERKTFLRGINGFRNKEGRWVWGIEPRVSYLCYAWDSDGTLGKLEISKSWYDDMNKVVDELEAIEGEPIEIDPFSNPIEGYPLVITKSKTDNGKTEYLIDKENPSRIKKESWDQFFERTALTEEQLVSLDAKKSLVDSYTNSYSLKDFEFAMDGLKRVDKEYGYGILDTEAFEAGIAKIIEILEDEAPAGTNEATEESGEAVTETKKTVEAEKEPKKEPKKVVKKVAKTVPKVDKSADISKYIEEVYGGEYTPQIPTTKKDIDNWHKTVMEEEVNGDLPLVAVEDFVAPKKASVAKKTTTKEAVIDPVEDENSTDEVVGDDTEKLRQQMEKLRSSRR